MVDYCKRYFLVDLGTLKYLIKYLYKENMQWYFKEINSKNVHAKNIKNKEIVDLLPRWSRGYL
jgi:phenylacetate-coenzyme A ligase PaaK-like adenylate-forming protein